MFIINFESEVMILVIISFIKLLKPKSRLIITELKNFGYIKNNITYIAISDFLYCFFHSKSFLAPLIKQSCYEYFITVWIKSQIRHLFVVLSGFLTSQNLKTLPRKKQIWRGRSMKKIQENITSHGWYFWGWYIPLFPKGKFSDII